MAKITRLESIGIDVDFFVPIFQILLRDFEKSFCLQRLNEGITQSEKKISLKIGVSRLSDLGGLLSAFQSQVTFVLALV